MRIVHAVRSDAYAGVERYVVQVACALQERGHEVRVIGGDPHIVPGHLPRAVRWSPATTTGDVLRRLWSLGGVDVVHAHMTAAEVATVLSKPRHRARVVATRHLAAPRGATRSHRLAGRLLSLAVDLEIAPSGFAAAFVNGPTLVIHNGVESQPQAPLTARRVVMLGRLEPEKRPDVGLRAWARSGLEGLGWRLTVAGAGSQLPRCLRLVEDLGVRGSVEFAGYVADPGALLASASMLLAPSPVESFGLAVVEAMARGVPAVAAAGGGHLETLGPQWPSFPPGDVDAAAALLRTWASDAALLGSFGATARRRQRDLFTVERHIAALETSYRDLTSAHVSVPGHDT